ncbi:polysaccharide deacetylase family protein [Gephyromycinifex aptenodytis]|uniref:polysaccharide deacetylase family protein n=1 Tax=Gephyromycinifex aptenodytis TaxID=2716227 RepID=UPI001B2FEB37|nr:polysaccharide deacetylase family protein [Gephyromycinifex aptenodytis]
MDQHISRRLILGAALTGAAAAVAGCGSGTAAPRTGAAGTGSSSGAPTGSPAASGSPTTSATSAPPASPAQIAARATVPVLCYHQVRPYQASDSGYTRQLLVMPPEKFRAQLDAIAGAGYTTVTPDAYLAALTTGAALPDKPVMLSFDDGKDNQPQTAFAELSKRDMTGVWYIMTVVIGNPGWTTKKQIRAVADAGHVIGSHTWDHHDVREYGPKDWAPQFEKSRETLRDISGQEVASFAFPYGAWNEAALPHLAKAGYSTAFQLNDKPLDPAKPLLTLRRSLAASDWTGPQVVAKLDELSA